MKLYPYCIYMMIEISHTYIPAKIKSEVRAKKANDIAIKIQDDVCCTGLSIVASNYAEIPCDPG